MNKLTFFACAALCNNLIGATPCGLTTEYRTEPCGLDAARPRLAWKIRADAGEKDVRSVAWRLLAATSREALAADRGDLWDSGHVKGAEAKAEWAGAPLATSQQVFWKVKTWTADGREGAWSEPASFTMGVMKPADWSAKWIGPAPCTRPDEDFGDAQWITAPANAHGYLVLECTFDFDGVAPDQYVEFVHAGLSLHDVDVNGHGFNKEGGYMRDWRYLRFRDITPWLVKGQNKIVVHVAADRPCPPDAAIDPYRVHGPKDVRAFLAKLVFPDGRTLGTTPANWTSPHGPVTALGGVRETSWGPQMILRAENASPAFVKQFEITKPVASALLHVTGVGFYEAALNGEKIGRKVLDPAPTAFDKRVLYSTYRLDGQLKSGLNELKILVGHGWYDMRSVSVWNFDTAPWRNFPRTIAQLEIVYADGSKDVVGTDASWRQVKSPIGYDDNFEGEVIGAWDPRMPDLEKTVVHAVEVEGPQGRLVAEAQPGAEIVRTIGPKTVKDCGAGTYVVDFGENVAGWMRATLRGLKKGTVVSFRYDERANVDLRPARDSVRDGIHDQVFTNNGRGAAPGLENRAIDAHFRYTGSHRVCPVDAGFQTDRFVSSGAAVETYEPHFQFSGFRYVVIRGLDQAPAPEDLTACFVQTAFPAIGSFECADATFNQLMKMGDGAYRSNFADGVPTDCPHREKNGWTGDASIASELAQYLYENTAAYEKWLRDILDAQLPNGNIPGIVPSAGWGYHWGNGPAWDSALPVIAWNLWIYRGDRRILEEVYPALKKYLAFTATKADKDGTVGHGLGDWVPVTKMPSTRLTSSCYYYQAQRIASEMARVLGLAQESADYATAAAKTAAGIQARFYKGDGVYDDGGQTAQAFPLAFGVTPAADRKAVEAKLVAAVERAHGHVNMGLLGTKHVFRALSRAGRTDLAWQMLTNPTKPSPVEWVQKGGTTLWEDWSDGASRNHIMFGDFLGWAYQYLAGIQLAEAPGSTSAVTVPTRPAFADLVIAPAPVPGLAWAKARVNGPQGEIVSSWRQEDGTFTLDVTVPPNTTARIRLPNGQEFRVGSGPHTFTCKQ